ncbi:MAG: hypothetical protein ABW321_09135 [Polyangiales bacterium]
MVLGGARRIATYDVELLTLWDANGRYFAFLKIVVFWHAAALAGRMAVSAWARQTSFVTLALAWAIWQWPHLQRRTLEDLHWKERIRAAEPGRDQELPIHPYDEGTQPETMHVTATSIARR